MNSLLHGYLRGIPTRESWLEVENWQGDLLIFKFLAEKGEKHSDDDDEGDDEHAGKATHNSYQVSEDSSG